MACLQSLGGEQTARWQGGIGEHFLVLHPMVTFWSSEGKGREHLESCTTQLLAPICLGQVWGMAAGNLCFIPWCSCSLRVAEKLPEANLLLKQLLSLLQHTGHNAG